MMNRDQKDEMRQLIREVIAEAVPSVVKETFVRFGVNVEDPIQTQQDMSFLRKLRTGAESLNANRIKTINGVLISGVFVLLAYGLKAYLANLLGLDKQGQ